MVAASSSLSFPFCHAPGSVIQPPVGALVSTASPASGMAAAASAVMSQPAAAPGGVSPCRSSSGRLTVSNSCGQVTYHQQSLCPDVPVPAAAGLTVRRSSRASSPNRFPVPHEGRVLGDDHEPPERHDRGAPHEPALAHRLLLTG